MPLSDLDQAMTKDAKAREYAEGAAWGSSAKDRAIARRWLRRHGYEHLIPGCAEAASESATSS